MHKIGIAIVTLSCSYLLTKPAIHIKPDARLQDAEDSRSDLTGRHMMKTAGYNTQVDGGLRNLK